MKKNPKLLLGIVLMFTILIAGGHQPASVPLPQEYPPLVFIYVKAVQNGNDIQILLSDTKDGQGVIAKGHSAAVGPETKVVWRRARDSKISRIRAVVPVLEDGPIFPGPGKTILGIKRRIRVKADATVGSQEEYVITVKTKFDGAPSETDPYLRIERTNTGGGRP